MNTYETKMYDTARLYMLHNIIQVPIYKHYILIFNIILNKKEIFLSFVYRRYTSTNLIPGP